MDKEKIRKYPNSFISEWAESNLLHVGRKTFNLLALQPCSLILPNIARDSSYIRSNFSVLLLGSPSMGKSTLCRLYKDVLTSNDEGTAYNPYSIKKVTEAKLSKDLARIKIFTLIVDDFSQFGENYDVIKVVEGAVGDEQMISRATDREETRVPVRGSGLLCGTWHDFRKYFEKFESGTFFRLNMLFVDLTDEQSEEIVRFINTGIGNETKTEESQRRLLIIKDYYEELSTIMAGEHKQIPQIVGYDIAQTLKVELYEKWMSRVRSFKRLYEKQYKQKSSHVFTREYEEGLRFLCVNAFLNVFNRKTTNGILQPNKDDLELAKDLMLQNLDNKLDILKSELYLRKYGVAGLRKAMEADSIPETTKKILLNLSKRN